MPLRIESARQIASLESRVDAVRAMIESMDEKPSPQVVNMLNRLDGLVSKANVMLDKDYSAPAAGAQSQMQ